MDIILTKLNRQDSKKLFEFELNNKEYFEKFVPSRSSEYFNYDSFLKILDNLLNEQEKNVSFFYLIKDSNGNILGRVNLTDIDYSKKSVDLGYRIGVKYTGKGAASKALKILIENIDTSKIKIINAKTTTSNIGSQKVMTNNNFSFISEDEDFFELNGKKEKFVYLKLTLKK